MQAIFMDVLDMKRVTANIVLKLLNFVQNQHHMNIRRFICILAAMYPFFQMIF